jgi:hypothetical protein
VALTIRIFGRWTVRAEDGIWRVFEGPPEVGLVLNAIADAPPAGVHVDEQRLREARVLYPDLQVLKRPDAYAVY